MPFQTGFNTTPDEDYAWECYWIQTCKFGKYSCEKCKMLNCIHKGGKIKPN